MTWCPFMRTALLVASVTVLTSTVAGAQESSAQRDGGEVSVLASVTIVGVEEIGMLSDDLSARGNSLQHIRSLPSSSLARASLQLQPTKLKNDRKTKLIIVGIAAAAITVCVIYGLRHSGGFTIR